MTIREESRDLLSVTQGYYIAHCITADYSLGAGLAKAIDEVFNMKEKLNLFYDKDIMGILGENVKYVGKALLVDNVYNLVIKKHPGKKAKYKNLRAALENMRDDMESKLVTKIAIPKLGCGHEGLEWERVLDIIESVFCDTDVQILVCL